EHVTEDLFYVEPLRTVFENLKKKKKGEEKNRVVFEISNNEVTLLPFIGSCEDNGCKSNSRDSSIMKMDSPFSTPSLVHRASDESKGKQECELCGCKFHQVALTFDGKEKIMQCMNRSCMSTMDDPPLIAHLPVGYVFNLSDDNSGWCTLNLNRVYYPNELFKGLFNFTKKNMRCDVDRAGHLLIPCPGQEDVHLL
ncbi:hypothetical protein PMAYCL1PPCAC_06839, partial [Pristionchus mayeri]